MKVSEGDGEIWKPDLYRVSIKAVRGISVHVYHAGDLLSMPAYADIREMPARDFFFFFFGENERAKLWERSEANWFLALMAGETHVRAHASVPRLRHMRTHVHIRLTRNGVWRMRSSLLACTQYTGKRVVLRGYRLFVTSDIAVLLRNNR